MKTIVVSPLSEVDTEYDSAYRVLQVTDSLQYTPGKKISKVDLTQLCLAKTWKVTVKR